MSLLADDILYMWNPRDATRKLPELINEFGKVSGYKINAQKFLAFLYTNSERAKREIKEIIPFTIATKGIKYLRINQPKKVKDLYSENHNTRMKEIRDNTNGEIYHVLGLEESRLWKWIWYPKQSKIQCKYHQITNGILHGIKTTPPNLHRNTKENPEMPK